MHPLPHERERPPISRVWLGVGALVTVLSLAGCRTKHDIDVAPTHHTVKIEPIYMTVDINLKVQRELEAFYDDVVGGAETQPGEDPRGGAQL